MVAKRGFIYTYNFMIWYVFYASMKLSLCTFLMIEASYLHVNIFQHVIRKKYTVPLGI